MIFSDAVIKKFNPLFAAYWNRQWNKNSVLYTLKKGETRNISAFLRDCIAKREIFDIPMVSAFSEVEQQEQKMYLIETYVKKQIKYKTDKEAWNEVEYWQDPLVTIWKKTGDCEDFSILIYSLAVLSGIPAWRIKLCAGYVKNPKTGKLGGHAYIIFLRNDMTWCVCDGTYYPTNQRIHLRPQHKEISYYKEIWWTANHEYSWAQHDVKLNFDGNKL